ncbi:related to poly(rC)-binding protein 3 [Serendipita indica DSM 11827]|uniref:Related to poly(RC)-binding protein 3 n=1 Tax=Serendipita indica (strain DSM 11827) TaxID=1109443 RepID=G4TUS7_SERID|nr:related to poly(rC)-binding protein 3 [Serendipita indica DSM 11827]
MLIKKTFHDVPSKLSPNGHPNRIYIIQPVVPGYPNAKWPGVVVFSEIYQVTGPVERFAGQIASQGYVVACPSSFHEFEGPEPIPYNTEGTDRGNKYKASRISLIQDATDAIDLLTSLPNCNGRIGVTGMCLGGHLAFRAAFDPRVKAAVCWFATDIHSATLGRGGDDSLAKVKAGALTGPGKAELIMIFGKQDTHVPRAGRDLIRSTLEDANVTVSFLEVQAQHAFIRDESSKDRWDAALTRDLFGLMMSAANAHNAGGDQPQSTSRSASPSAAQDTLTLRALVGTKDAGIIIGKAGKNVADLREQTGVKAGVSKVVAGVHERVLSVTGSVQGVAKAYTTILQQLVTSSPSSTTAPANPSNHTIIRLLISHNLMGTIIGRNGLKIKNIQDSSGARMVAQKDMLPQSTERIVEVQGSPEAIGKAIEEIGKCLLEDWERGLGTVLYQPGAGGPDAITNILAGSASRRGSYANPSVNALTESARRLSLVDFTPSVGSANSRSTNGSSAASSGATSSVVAPSVQSQSSQATAIPPSNAPPGSGQPLRTQSISIPSDMVGCIIGRAGTKITEIRRLSGSKISIAKGPHDETGERMFTIVGTPESNEKALYLLYNQLESEKERRVGRELAQQSETAV